MNKKLILCVCSNLLLTVFGAIGCTIQLLKWGFVEEVQYYTMDSNIIMTVAAAIFTIALIRLLVTGKPVPEWVHVLKFVATVTISITFIVVITILIPYDPEKRWIFLFGPGMLYQHTICPILAIMNLLLLESDHVVSRRAALLSCVPTLAYAFVSLILNILRIMNGPYFFLFVYKQPVYMSVLWFVLINGMAVGIGFGYRAVQKCISRKAQKGS